MPLVYLKSLANLMRITLTRLKAVLFVYAVVMVLPANSQNQGFQTISTAQGLSQGMVYDLLQDREGFIWVATKEGLNRFDGYSFKVFAYDPYNPHSISSNTITSLFEDSKGRLWVGTENSGLNIYDKKTGTFVRLSNNPDDSRSLSGNRIISRMAELPDGRVAVIAEGRNLNIVDLPQNFTTEGSIPTITRLSLPQNEQVHGIGKFANGQIWITGEDSNLYRFTPASMRIELIRKKIFFNRCISNNDGTIWINSKLMLFDGKNTYPLFDKDLDVDINDIAKDADGKLWLVTDGQLELYDISKWQRGKPLNAKKARLFASGAKDIRNFIIDKAGVLWAGTKGFGLQKYNISSRRFKHLSPGFSVYSIVPLDDKKLLLSGWLFHKAVTWQDSLLTDPLSQIKGLDKYQTLIVSRAGEYWIWKDYEHLLRYNPVTRSLIDYTFPVLVKTADDKQPMLEDSHGNIWICGAGGSLMRVEPATGKLTAITIKSGSAKLPLLNEPCTAFYEDRNGVFWIGTEDGFAQVTLNGSTTPSTKWYRYDKSNPKSLNYNHVSCFLDDPLDNNFLWIATKGGGLNRLNKNNGTFLHLTTQNGLPNNVVYGLLADGDGNIWGSTNKGIFCLSISKQNGPRFWLFRNFTKNDGLQDDEFNTAAYAKLPNGNLAFGGVNGLNIFDPKAVLTNGFMPNVFITDILVNNQPVSPGDESGVLQQTIEQSKNIRLTYLQDILTLEFSSLDFTTPTQNKYRYQLVGVDEDWVESGTRRSATYLHLPPGSFTFKVQGSNSQGLWSDHIAELNITVLPPWWRTWWAYAVYVLLILLSIRAYFRFTVNRATLKKQLEFEHLEAKRIKELDAVKTQLYTNITHEFRTPLTVILGMAHQVQTNPSAHLNHGMDMIIRNGQNLLNLVNEMLDLSKLQTGKMQLQLISGNLVTFIQYIIESFQSMAESQQKQLHFLTETNALYVQYDPEKIRQVIANLLSNALKFTPEKGNIYISVNDNTAPQKGYGQLVYIKVKDTGIGIPESEVSRVFDRFYQLDNGHSRKAEGTGIGLALTKELVKLMDGEITVKSPPAGANKGSEFTVTLPLKRVAPVHNAGADYKAAEQPLKNVSESTPIPLSYETSGNQQLILLVEDNADVVAYTASCLPGYRLAVGKDGQEGFDIAVDNIPDLIITDVMMPLVDGFELCRRLKNDERTSHIPIIMLTAKANFESKMEGLQQGADVYLEKPFNRDELTLRIKKLLELRSVLQRYYVNKLGLNTLPTPVEKLPEPAPAKVEYAIEDEFVKKVRQAIEMHLSEPNFTVEQLCKLIFMSHSQLHRKLDALTGYSPNRFIRVLRLKKAKELLMEPANSIGSIAQQCGYNDSGYLARVFKQEHGITPQEWRAANKSIV